VRLHLRRAIQATIKNAISHNSSDQAARILYRAAYDARSLEAFAELRETIELLIPENLLIEDVKIAVAYTRSLAGSGDTPGLLQFLKRAAPHFPKTDRASLDLYLASALHRTGHSDQALRTLTSVLTCLQDVERGLAFAYLGVILYALHHPKWTVPFRKMRQHLQGRTLGMHLVNEGNCWFLQRDHVRSNACYREAIPLLEHDHVNQAMARFNLGMNLLRDCDLGFHQGREVCTVSSPIPRWTRHVLQHSTRLARRPTPVRPCARDQQ
jgi:hypothetical protein